MKLFNLKTLSALVAGMSMMIANENADHYALAMKHRVQIANI